MLRNNTALAYIAGLFLVFLALAEPRKRGSVDDEDKTERVRWRATDSVSSMSSDES